MGINAYIAGGGSHGTIDPKPLLDILCPKPPLTHIWGWPAVETGRSYPPMGDPGEVVWLEECKPTPSSTADWVMNGMVQIDDILYRVHECPYIGERKPREPTSVDAYNTIRKFGFRKWALSSQIPPLPVAPEGYPASPSVKTAPEITVTVTPKVFRELSEYLSPNEPVTTLQFMYPTRVNVYPNGVQFDGEAWVTLPGRDAISSFSLVTGDKLWKVQ